MDHLRSMEYRLETAGLVICFLFFKLVINFRQLVGFRSVDAKKIIECSGGSANRWLAEERMAQLLYFEPGVNSLRIHSVNQKFSQIDRWLEGR